MALNKQDKEWIKSAVKEAVIEVIIPIREDVQKHGQSLYGETGNNGLRKDTENLQSEMQSVKVKMGWIAGGISAGLFIMKEIGSYLIGHKSS